MLVDVVEEAKDREVGDVLARLLGERIRIGRSAPHDQAPGERERALDLRGRSLVHTLKRGRHGARDDVRVRLPHRRVGQPAPHGAK